MTQGENSGVGRLSRREAMGLVGAAGLGVAAALNEQVANAQAPPAGPVAPWTLSSSAPGIPSWNTELKQLAPNVYAYIQAGGLGKPNMSNAALIVGPDSMMAIDTLTAPLLTKAFIAAAKRAGGGKPITHVIDTHHHGDHIAGNQFFVPCEIVSHEYCRDEVAKQAAAVAPGTKFAKREGFAEGTEERKIAVPTTAFNDKLVYNVGNVLVEWMFLGPAHTWGDIVAYLPKEKILFAGDIFFSYITPFGHNAHISKWIEVCDRINKMDVDVIVPGHGPVGNKNELAQMAEYYVFLKSEVKKRYAAGMTPGRAAAEIKMTRWQNWAVPEQLVRNVVRLYAEFSATLVPDVMDDANNNAIAEYNALKKGATAQSRTSLDLA